MCERCGGERKPVVIDGTSRLTHYCFSLPGGFGWALELQPQPKQGQEEKQ